MTETEQKLQLVYEALFRLKANVEKDEDNFQQALNTLKDGNDLVSSQQEQLKAKHEHCLLLEDKITKLTHENCKLTEQLQTITDAYRKSESELTFRDEMADVDSVYFEKLEAATAGFLNYLIKQYKIEGLNDFECPFVLNLAVRFQQRNSLEFYNENE